MISNLSPKELSQAINRSESSIKRWVDNGIIRADKTSGGHRKISLEEAIRFVRTNKVKVVNPDIFGFSDLLALSNEEWTQVTENERFYELLVNGQAEQARGYIILLYLNGMSVAEICDGPITSAMQRVGELWKHNKEGIGIEHQATDICIHALNVFRAIFRVQSDAPKALGGAPPEDPYIIPSTMVAITLLSEGFSVINYGPNTPFQEFSHAIKMHHPTLVWLSISHIKRGLKLESGINHLYETTKGSNASLIMGGREWKHEKMILPPDLVTCKSMVELVTFVKGLRTNH